MNWHFDKPFLFGMEFVGLSMIMKRKFHRREFMVFNGSTILVRFKFNDLKKKEV